MKWLLAAALSLGFVMAAAPSFAQSKADKCAAYADEAMRNTPTSTGIVRGAARGAVVGGIFGNAGGGAGAGAVVGTARAANQRRQSRQHYYDSCMAE